MRMMIVLVCALLASPIQAGESDNLDLRDAENAPLNSDTVLAQGKKIAQEHCKRCHAIGKDDPSEHMDAPPFRDIANQYSVWSLGEALAEGIVTGHPDMPEFVFQPDEIGVLLAYMDSLKTDSQE